MNMLIHSRAAALVPLLKRQQRAYMACCQGISLMFESFVMLFCMIRSEKDDDDETGQDGFVIRVGQTGQKGEIETHFSTYRVYEGNRQFSLPLSVSLGAISHMA
jgi:hypothetical protein